MAARDPFPAPLPDEPPAGTMPELGGPDALHLERARVLARRGWGRVHPNPMVGCVVVKDGRVVGEGWHEEFGGPHAEVLALATAGPDARGATAYVSLEPCRHRGKTPPCTDALINAGVRRVIFGAADPGESSGGGGELLSASGIEVVGPVYSSEEGRRENPAFHLRPHDRPWTILKLAVSLDGAVTRIPGSPTALSGQEALHRVHRLRAGMDAVLVGAGTVRADQPRLTVRRGTPPRVPPIRVLLDPGPAHDLPEPGPDDPPIWVAAVRGGAEDRRSRLEGSGIRLLDVDEDPGDPERVDPRALMAALRREGVRALLCEGGPTVGRSLLDAGLVDRLILVIAPRALGPGALPAFPFPESRWTPAGPPVRLGTDLWCEWDRSDADGEAR